MLFTGTRFSFLFSLFMLCTFKSAMVIDPASDVSERELRWASGTITFKPAAAGGPLSADNAAPDPISGRPTKKRRLETSAPQATANQTVESREFTLEASKSASKTQAFGRPARRAGRNRSAQRKRLSATHRLSMAFKRPDH